MNSNIEKFFKTKGLVLQNDAPAQSRWLSWYQGSDSFYKYQVLMPNKTYKTIERLSMNILSKVCADWASLLLNEKTLITIADTALNTKFQELVTDTSFTTNVQQFLERVFAIGTGALVFGSTVDQKPQISYVDGTRCFVAETQNGVPTKAAFTVDYPQAGKDAVLASVHSQGKIENYIFDQKGNSITTEKFDIKATETPTTQSFVWLKPAISRRDSWSTTFGQSIFATATDPNKLLDLVFDGYANEFLLGRKRIFLSQDILTWKKDEKGVARPTFDLRDGVFHILPDMSGGNGEGGVQDKIKEVDMELRQEEFSNAIQDALNYVSANCYLGNHYYKFNAATGQATATQVIMENTDLFRNIKKQENALEPLLKQAVVSLMAIAGSKIKLSDVTITFDDSIMIDEEGEKNSDRQDVRDGLMSKVEYRMKWYGETQEQAKKAVGEMEPIDLGV
jgi:hypothetical protein